MGLKNMGLEGTGLMVLSGISRLALDDIRRYRIRRPFKLVHQPIDLPNPLIILIPLRTSRMDTVTACHFFRNRVLDF